MLLAWDSGGGSFQLSMVCLTCPCLSLSPMPPRAFWRACWLAGCLLLRPSRVPRAFAGARFLFEASCGRSLSPSAWSFLPLCLRIHILGLCFHPRFLVRRRSWSTVPAPAMASSLNPAGLLACWCPSTRMLAACARSRPFSLSTQRCIQMGTEIGRRASRASATEARMRVRSCSSTRCAMHRLAPRSFVFSPSHLTKILSHAHRLEDCHPRLQ